MSDEQLSLFDDEPHVPRPNPYAPQFTPPTEIDWNRTPGEDGLFNQEREVVTRVLDGMEPNDAALQVGYISPGAGTEIMRRPHVQDALNRALDAAGLNDALIATKIRDGLNATKRVFVDGDQVATDEDFNIQHKYLDTLLTLRSAYPTRNESATEGSWEEVVLSVRRKL